MSGRPRLISHERGITSCRSAYGMTVRQRVRCMPSDSDISRKNATSTDGAARPSEISAYYHCGSCRDADQPKVAKIAIFAYSTELHRALGETKTINSRESNHV
jgi:hypothetical protein